ncbi:MAG: glutaredoxin 3 [Novosphingobium sp.]
MIAPPCFKRSRTVSAAKVEIYTKWGCPYCVMAKQLLDRKGVAYTEHDITLGGPKRAEMQERAPGAMTVPQIFINDRAIGGSDDIHALDREGKLDPLLGL